MYKFMRSELGRKIQSEGTKRFNKTEAGKLRKQKMVAAQKEWFTTEAGKRFLRERTVDLVKSVKSGEDHYLYNPNKTEMAKYRAKVNRITRKQPLHTLENFDKPRGVSGVEGNYQLDHIIPIHYGFHNNIPAEDIGNIKNLQFITWEENSKKKHYYDDRQLNTITTNSN